MMKRNLILKLLSVVLALVMVSGVMLVFSACKKDNVKIVDYTIEYDLKGGDAVNHPENPDTYNLLKLPLTIKAPTKDGYIFTGWTSERNTSPSLEVRLSITTVNNLHFVANWVEDTPLDVGVHRIQFNSNVTVASSYTVNGGIFNNKGFANGQLCEYEDLDLPLTVKVANQAKYEFVRWTDATGRSISTSQQFTITEETLLDGIITANWKEIMPAGYATGKVKAPDFELKDLKGNTVRLSDYVGVKAVFISFWQYT